MYKSLKPGNIDWHRVYRKRTFPYLCWFPDFDKFPKFLVL